MDRKYAKTKVNHAMRRTSIIFVMIAIVIILINIAPNYIKNSRKDERIKLIINNNEITNSLKEAIVNYDNEFYLSLADYKNFFDEYLLEDNDNIITTSNTKTVRLKKGNNKIMVNGSEVTINHTSMSNNGNTYLPISDMANVYGYEYKYSNESKTMIISSLNKKKVQAIASRDLNIYYKPTSISRALEKIKRGETITISQDYTTDNDIEINGWLRVCSQNGTLGYIKKTDIINREVVRENLTKNKINGKVSLVWDYYESGENAPNREGKIEGVNAVSPSFYQLNADSTINKNVSREYIEWAHFNNYKVWPTLSNMDLNNIDTMSSILSTFESREVLIENILRTLTENSVDGINIDFENMYKEDKDKFSRFIIELAPRLHEVGLSMCVDVTEPDGSDTWSLCYNRNVLGNVADYLIFVAYEQHGTSSKVAGSNASYDWVQNNIKKFIDQEVVSPDKIILANAFYTRLWKEENGELTSTVVNMNDVNLPEGVQKKWDENAKQYYVEYTTDNALYKIWIEDEESISAKLDLVNQYKLSGAGFWEKDRENMAVWKVVKDKLNIK